MLNFAYHGKIRNYSNEKANICDCGKAQQNHSGKERRACAEQGYQDDTTRPPPSDEQAVSAQPLP